MKKLTLEQIVNCLYDKTIEPSDALKLIDKLNERSCDSEHLSNTHTVINLVCEYGMNSNNCIRKADTCFECLKITECQHIQTHKKEEYCSHTGNLEYVWEVCDDCGIIVK